MDWEASYYFFGTLYFAFTFILIVMLIVMAFLLWRNLNKFQLTVQEAMEEKRNLATMLPMLLLATFEASSWWRRLRK
jgi:hypothetical protein